MAIILAHINDIYGKFTQLKKEFFKFFNNYLVKGQQCRIRKFYNDDCNAELNACDPRKGLACDPNLLVCK